MAAITKNVINSAYGRLAMRDFPDKVAMTRDHYHNDDAFFSKVECTLWANNSLNRKELDF